MQSGRGGHTRQEPAQPPRRVSAPDLTRGDRDATVLWDDDLTPAVLQAGDGASITTLLRVLRLSAECWGVTADDAWWAYGAGVATLDVPRHTAEFLARLLAVHQRRLRTP
ncbi:hypothetical protein ACFZCY_41490 [Streptomyces sp. NPDC007983]|uniref:hypothetical protein n=1 Tax=Streptomyces sp. NPDC007983 TaxID=3364800 RepID=UPI0036EF6FB3